MKNLGIIYCPSHRPFTSPEKRWARISAALDAQGLEYDMIQSESPDSVGRLVTMLLNNKYQTIIIAGGDSALNCAACSIMKAEKHIRDNVTLGVIPNGVMNDFAAFWGFSYDDTQQAAASISQRRIRKIDVGYIRYTDKRGQSHTRPFLNCVNIGLLAGIQRLKQQTRRRLWSRKLTLLASAVMLVFVKKLFRITYTLNFTTKEQRITTACIGSATGYGQTPNAVPYNGLLDITIVQHSPMSQFLGGLYLFARGKILNHKHILPYRSPQIDLTLAKGTPVTVDGHPMPTPVGTFRITVQHEALNFIIEKR